MVFGPNASVADDECWKENIIGYWAGNCGYGNIDPISWQPGLYRKCAEK